MILFGDYMFWFSEPQLYVNAFLILQIGWYEDLVLYS